MRTWTSTSLFPQCELRDAQKRSDFQTEGVLTWTRPGRTPGSAKHCLPLGGWGFKNLNFFPKCKMEQLLFTQ